MSADESTIQVQAATQPVSVAAAVAPVTVAVATEPPAVEETAATEESGVFNELAHAADEATQKIAEAAAAADSEVEIQSAAPQTAVIIDGPFQIAPHADGTATLRCLHCGTTATLSGRATE